MHRAITTTKGITGGTRRSIATVPGGIERINGDTTGLAGAVVVAGDDAAILTRVKNVRVGRIGSGKAGLATQAGEKGEERRKNRPGVSRRVNEPFKGGGVHIEAERAGALRW